MLDMDTIKDLKQQRVKVTLSAADGQQGDHFGVLRGVTSEKIWIDDRPFPVEQVLDVEAAPLYCANCGKSTMLLHDGVCASCYREGARQKQAHQEPCEVCGSPGIRDVKNRSSSRFLCAVHHAESGNGLAVHPFRGPVAPCATQNVDSPLHEWAQVRGARFRCIRCKKAEKWDSELLAQIMRSRG